MSTNLQTLQFQNLRTDVPEFRAGDTVRVNYKIVEGDKERIQPFKVTIIAIQGRGVRRSLVVRRIVQGEGVERIFPLHGPRVKDVLVTRRSKARKAKLSSTQRTIAPTVGGTGWPVCWHISRITCGWSPGARKRGSLGLTTETSGSAPSAIATNSP